MVHIPVISLHLFCIYLIRSLDIFATVELSLMGCCKRQFCIKYYAFLLANY